MYLLTVHLYCHMPNHYDKLDVFMNIFAIRWVEFVVVFSFRLPDLCDSYGKFNYNSLAHQSPPKLIVFFMRQCSKIEIIDKLVAYI